MESGGVGTSTVPARNPTHSSGTIHAIFDISIGFELTGHISPFGYLWTLFVVEKTLMPPCSLLFITAWRVLLCNKGRRKSNGSTSRGLVGDLGRLGRIPSVATNQFQISLRMNIATLEPNSNSYFLYAANEDGCSTHRLEYFFDLGLVRTSQVQTPTNHLGDLD